MGIVIKKKVFLDFLGDEYKDSHLTFRAVSIAEYDDEKSFIGTIREETVKRFIEGKIAQNGEMVDVTQENITELPAEVFTEAFQYITGNKLDPKS